MRGNRKMDEDGESCWNCLQRWEWMWILYFWVRTRQGDVFPVFQVNVKAEAACWKKLSEPGVFSDEQTRVNFVVQEASNQWGDEDPVFGMDEDFFWKLWLLVGGWNIQLPATNTWAESGFERCQKMSVIAIEYRWTNGNECEDRKFLFWSSEDGSLQIRSN